MNQWWSWALTLVGVTGLYLAGKKNWWGWAIGLGAQVLWVAYAVSTSQWGFLMSAGAYGWVYLRNLLAWRAEEVDSASGRVEPEAPSQPSNHTTGGLS